MYASISVFVTCVEAIIYLLLYDLDDCTFKPTLCQELNGSIEISTFPSSMKAATIMTVFKRVYCMNKWN